MYTFSMQFKLYQLQIDSLLSPCQQIGQRHRHRSALKYLFTKALAYLCILYLCSSGSLLTDTTLSGDIFFIGFVHNAALYVYGLNMGEKQSILFPLLWSYLSIHYQWLSDWYLLILDQIRLDYIRQILDIPSIFANLFK